MDKAVTDEDGYFEFDNLPFGRYEVVEQVNEYWQVVDDYTEASVSIDAENPEYTDVTFTNQLRNVCTNIFSGYGENAKKVYGESSDSWYTYVTLAAGKETETFSLRAGNPGPDGEGGRTVGTFTATIEGDYLLVKVALDTETYSHGLINGLPEINVGVSNSISFFAGAMQNNSSLNATSYRDRDDDDGALFRIPLGTLRRDDINIFVNGVVVYAPEKYEIPPELDVR